MGTDRKITIITPVFNAEKDMETCILSVVGQTYPTKEHLIIDGASTDGTLEIIKRYAEKYSHIKLISEKDEGIYDAMNKGIDLASGEWIYFLGCDDVFYDESVLEKIFNLNDIDLYDVVYGNVFWGDTGKVYDGKFSLFKLMETNICQQAIFYRLALFGKFGKFDTKYKYCADYLFNVKCFNDDKIKIKYVDNVIAKYSTNGFSTRITDDKFVKDKPLIFKEHFPEPYVEVWEKNKALLTELEGKTNQIVHLNWYLNERNLQLEEKERQLEEHHRLLLDKEVRIQSILSSYSWKITSPLRKFFVLFFRSR